jgi:hypothetical protein
MSGTASVSRGGTAARALPPWARTTITLTVFTALSIAFSWPLATDPLGSHVSRQFDVYSLAWLSGIAPTLDASLSTSLSAWPLGEHLGRPDSFVLLALARWLGPLGHPWFPAALCALAGPVVSAWAAERFAANHMGARFPWSLLAGVGYAFSGIAATALLEGHLYALLNPWLPLLAGAWSRATGPDGRARDGVLSGVWWTLCLLTTAYSGIGATLLVLALGMRGVLGRTLTVRAGAAAAAVAASSGGLYLWRFLGAGGLERVDNALTGEAAVGIMAAGSARLGTLAGWSASADGSMHSIAPTLGFTVLILAAAAPIVLRGRRDWRLWLGLAGLGIALSLGPTLRLYDQGVTLPWLLWPLTKLDIGASFFHFPARMLWVTGLGLGAVAARVATKLAERSTQRALPLLACAGVDALLGTGAPLRTVQVPIGAPTAYEAAPEDLAVLDLVPSFHGQSTDLEWYWNNLTCSYQLTHHRPIATQCIGTTQHRGPRVVLGTWLMSELLAGSPPAPMARTLGDLGFGAVAVHPDLFTGDDRAVLLAGMEAALGPPVASSTDAGDPVVLFAVPQTKTEAQTSEEARRRDYALLAARYE